MKRDMGKISNWRWHCQTVADA